MSSVDKALETQLKNIQTKTGKTLDELFTLIRQSGLAKHGEMRDVLKRDLGLGHGDANTPVHVFRQSDGKPGAQTTGASPDDVLDEIYAGPKAALRLIHEKVMAAITDFGPFEIAPKKNYVSLRRKKQFAMIGPATKTRVEVGLNMKGVEATSRLMAMPAGGMCQYKVNVTAPEEVDQELLGWIRQAYDSAG
jgi:predicted transport protein